MTKQPTTWPEVREAIRARGLRVSAVADVMGERRDSFSRRINDTATTPTPEYVRRVMDAFDILARGIPTA